MLKPLFIGKNRKVFIPLPRTPKQSREGDMPEIEIRKVELNVEWVPFGVSIYVAKDLHGYDGIMMNKKCGLFYHLWSRYRIKTPSIFVREKLFETPERLKWVLLHEIGHHLKMTNESSKKTEETLEIEKMKSNSKMYKKMEDEATETGKLWGYLFLA